MTLEIEKLTHDLDQMSVSASRRLRLRQERIEGAQATIHRHATNWDAIESLLQQALEQADFKYFSAARPLDAFEPLNSTVDAPLPPATATIVATDGSQIMPDRHAAHLYYLLNVGGIIYHHGVGNGHESGRPPEVFSNPEIKYPEDDISAADFGFSGAKVSIERDLMEIETLAEVAREHQEAARPLLALLDQRLLYWPIGSSESVANRAVEAWRLAMTAVRQSDAWLAGYIDRPGKSVVITLLQMLANAADRAFDWKLAGTAKGNHGLRDIDLFQHLLGPGQRSKVFVEVSTPNQRFAQDDSDNEVCFFYMNPGRSGRHIARVDLPLSVAENAAAVEAIHALLYSQCQLLGDYPYVLARADEMAVVGRQDQAELDLMIELAMQRAGIAGTVTAKQESKELARGGKTRHKGP